MPLLWLVLVYCIYTPQHTPTQCVDFDARGMCYECVRLKWVFRINLFNISRTPGRCSLSGLRLASHSCRLLGHPAPTHVSPLAPVPSSKSRTSRLASKGTLRPFIPTPECGVTTPPPAPALARSAASPPCLSYTSPSSPPVPARSPRRRRRWQRTRPPPARLRRSLPLLSLPWRFSHARRTAVSGGTGSRRTR